MRSPSWSKDELLWREVVAALARAGEHDLVERLEQSRRAGRRPNPEIAYRHYRRRHEGTDKELWGRFIRAHGRQIAVLGLKIGAWGSARNALASAKRASDRVKSRRQSSSQFMWSGFGRQKSSLRVIRLGLARQKVIVDRAQAEYLLDQGKKVLLGEKPTALF
jgi:hypothetical protein